MANTYEKENSNYVKKISDLTIQLKATNDELKELQNKNSSVGLDQMLEEGDEGNSLLEDQLDECKKVIEKLKQENKYYEKQIEQLKQGEVLAKKAEEFEAKNKSLNDTIEIMKKNIEELKNQKKKSDDDLKEEIAKI